jgi:hypothetical protein
VAILSDTNAAQSLGPFAVIYIIIGGWIFIITCFVIIYFIYYIQPPDHRIVEYPASSDESVKYNNEDIYNKDVSQATTTTRWYSDISKWFIWSSGNNTETGQERTHY